MKWELNSFRGILLQLKDANIAVNGGGSLEDMEQAYIINGQVPHAMLLTCEHYHRSHNVVEFCKKHNVPLIATDFSTRLFALEDVKTVLFPGPINNVINEIGYGIVLFPVKYDSINPFFFTVYDGGTRLGIVPDGKILPEFAKYLTECDTVILGNRLHIPEKALPIIQRRLKSVYNTQEELNEIFNNYHGEIIYI